MMDTLRMEFPQLNCEVRGKPLVYLDNAATTLKPRAVIDAVSNHYRTEVANIHRGVHYLSESATNKFEKTREDVAQFIGAESASEIVFTRGTTEGINLLASSLTQALAMKAGDEILITEMEHHANIVPWQIAAQRFGFILKFIPMNDEGLLDLSTLETLLTAKTKIVSAVWVSNALGTVNPIAKLIKSSHKVGAKIILDAAQAVAHLPVKVQDIDCDFLVFSAHKLYGPTGVGVLYGKKSLLQSMPPYQGGGDMIQSVSMEKSTYADPPARFEAGTPAIAEVIGLGAAIHFLKNLDLPSVHKHERSLMQYAEEMLRHKIPKLRIIGNCPQRIGSLSFVLEDIHPHDIGSIVDSEGVAIRTGHHCCQPIMNHFKIPATARASFSMYNTKEDVDQLVWALQRVREIFGE